MLLEDREVIHIIRSYYVLLATETRTPPDQAVWAERGDTSPSSATAIVS